MLANTKIILLLALTLSLANASFAQNAAYAAGPAINSSIVLNATVPNLYLDLPMINFTSPVSQGEFLTGTDLHVSMPGSGSSNVTLYNPDFNSLAPMGVNIVITPNHGTAPFMARVFIGVTPATASGNYSLRVDAVSGTNSTANTVITLSLANPSNHTFLYTQNPPSKAEAEQELSKLYATSTSTSVATTTVPQPQSQPSSGGYLYLAVAVIAVVVAAIYLLLRRRK